MTDVRVITGEEQLRLWVEGTSVHRSPDGLLGNPRSECTPDFSCCRPTLQAPREERERFAASSGSERDAMLSEFLGKLLGSEGHEVETS